MSHTNPPEILDDFLAKAAQKVEVGAYYFHYKNPNKRYQIIELGVIEADETVAVLYRITDGVRPGVLWIRPLTSFLETVPVDGKQVPRFTKCT